MKKKISFILKGSDEQKKKKLKKNYSDKPAMTNKIIIKYGNAMLTSKAFDT